MSSPFTGTWIFDPILTELASAPTEWVQEIHLDGLHLHVRETILRDTERITVEVDALIDGSFYGVAGSSLVEEIAYTWDQRGRGLKNGSTILTERVSIQRDDTLNIAMVLFINEKERPLGTARFRRKSKNQ